MRASTDIYTSVDASIQASESSLQKAMNQLSSGKRVSLPSDDPLAFSQNLQSLAESASVDRFTRNADDALSQAQMADSALSSVVTSLNSALSLGTEGGNSYVTSTQRNALTQQIQSVLQSVVSQANTAVGGVALFGGTSAVAEAFVADPSNSSTFVYQGNGNVNQTTIGVGQAVSINVPGNEIFSNPSGNVFGSLQQMLSAVQSGNAVDIGTATASLNAAIAHVDQVRAIYGSTANQLTAQTDALSQEKVTLSSQQQSLVGADIATSATALTQAQTANSAVLAVAAKVLPESLLNYLH